MRKGAFRGGWIVHTGLALRLLHRWGTTRSKRRNLSRGRTELDHLFTELLAVALPPLFWIISASPNQILNETNTITSEKIH